MIGGPHIDTSFLATGTVFGQQSGSTLNFSGTLTGLQMAPFFMSALSLDPNTPLVGYYSGTIDLTTGASQQTINIVNAPEPATIVLLGSGLLAGFGRRVRRRVTRLSPGSDDEVP